MEDSYTVHRRRKAAARRREKTPEAPRAVEHDEDESNEQIEARAKILQMVEDTEKMEEVLPAPANVPTDVPPVSKESEVIAEAPTDKSEPIESAADPPENRTDEKSVKKEIPRRRERFDSSSSGDRSEMERPKREKKLRKVRKERKDPPVVVEPPPAPKNKQIIPLSDDSLLEDLKKAQRTYQQREIGILDPQYDDYIDPKIEAALRRRKKSFKPAQEAEKQDEKVFGSWSKVCTWIWSFAWRPRGQKPSQDLPAIEDVVPEVKKIPVLEDKPPKSEFKLLRFFRLFSDLRNQLKLFAAENPREIYLLRRERNKCMAQLMLIIIYCGLGAFVFRFTEGAFEAFYKCGVKRVKRDFLDSLWVYSHNLREDDWKSMARRKLMEFEEQLHTAHEAGVHSYSGQKSWTFLNAVVYCITVITTIGYGHISPSTTTGRAVTIIYAIFGIPMFLIILADFGKLFTRGIKFLWAFVRRLYYTGSCKKVRKTGPVQEVMKGVQLVYDFATFRRPSQMDPEELEEMRKQPHQQTVLNVDANVPPSHPDTPATPAMSNFAIDDEFNLPISVAITILLGYIFIGATVYNLWERWGFFESFYFVFISMSTIGFGDYVPKHPIYMMCSIVYLVFGLALTSMCINVVQTMLSDSFKHATQKIGATIGFEVAEDDGSMAPAVELADVHATIREEDEEAKAPTVQKDDENL